MTTLALQYDNSHRYIVMNCDGRLKNSLTLHSEQPNLAYAIDVWAEGTNVTESNRRSIFGSSSDCKVNNTASFNNRTKYDSQRSNTARVLAPCIWSLLALLWSRLIMTGQIHWSQQAKSTRCNSRQRLDLVLFPSTDME